MTTTDTDTCDTLGKVRAQINAAEQEFGIAANSVRLIAVSKTKPVRQIQAAIDAGQRDFGENYLDEAVTKIAELAKNNCCWHFIGAIQSNKTRHVAANFHWAHCIDREKIARRISAQRSASLPPINLCIQVNIDDESSKSGIAPEQAHSLADSLAAMPNITLRGLMAIPMHSNDFESQRRPFAALRTLFEALRSNHPTMDTLSMGMSGDLRAAIAEGATMVRIGTAIFGARSPKNND